MIEIVDSVLCSVDVLDGGQDVYCFPRNGNGEWLSSILEILPA